MHLSRTVGEIENQSCNGLGLLSVTEGIPYPTYEDFLPVPETKPEAVFDALWQTAKSIWPEDTAKAEAWVKDQAVRYGVAEAKAQAAGVAQNPLTWLVLAGAVWFIFMRPKR